MRIACKLPWARGDSRSVWRSVLHRHTLYCSKPALTPPNQDEVTQIEDHISNHGLPLPPILDSAMQASRKRQKRPKLRQLIADRTPLQRALALNPYAQALTTPLRACAVTESVMPRHQLQAFITVFKPTDVGANDPEALRSVPHLIPEHLDPTLASASASSLPSPSAMEKQGANTHKSQIPGQARSYALASSTAMRRLSLPKTGRRSRGTRDWQRLVSRNALDRFGMKARDAWIWDDGTADSVREMLRGEVERLWCKWFRVRHPKAVGCVHGLGCFDGPSRTQAKLPVLEPDEVMCFLCFGPDHTIVRREIGDWARAVGLEYVQCFDIPTLLGDERAATMRTERAMFRRVRVLAVRKDQLVMNAVLALMKLDDYLDDLPSASP